MNDWERRMQAEIRRVEMAERRHARHEAVVARLACPVCGHRGDGGVCARCEAKT